MTARDFIVHALAHWDDITSPDLHETFGLDSLLDEFWDRPWWYIRSRIFALLDTHSRLATSIRQP